MTIQDIYKKYDAYTKPYAKWTIIDVELLHNETMKAINEIGNANPHWNKLNQIETDLRIENWIF